MFGLVRAHGGDGARRQPRAPRSSSAEVFPIEVCHRRKSCDRVAEWVGAKAVEGDIERDLARLSADREIAGDQVVTSIAALTDERNESSTASTMVPEIPVNCPLTLEINHVSEAEW